MKKFLSKVASWLGVKNNKRELVLVRVLTADDIYHYRWMPETQTLEKLSFSPLRYGDKMEKLPFKAVEMISFDNELIKENIGKGGSPVLSPRLNDYLYQVITLDSHTHYIWSQSYLDALSRELQPVFKSDVEPVSDIVALRRVNVGDSFIFNSRVWDLRRGADGRQVVTESMLRAEDI